MTIFDFSNYKDFVSARVREMPKQGRGQWKKIAELLGIHSTMVTHIFRGHANLTVEGALKISRHWGLNELETEYFIALVQRERMADTQSRAYYDLQIKKISERSQSLAERFEEKKIDLTELEKATFYSGFHFSAIRLAIATSAFKDPSEIASAINLPVNIVSHALPKLLTMGLIKFKNGKFIVGPHRTYVGADSPWVVLHHANWRRKALADLETTNETDLVYTCPVALSKLDQSKVRNQIIEFLRVFRKISDPSEPEELCYLNIDWRQVTNNRK